MITDSVDSTDSDSDLPPTGETSLPARAPHAEEGATSSGERLQKLLARAGVASRRGAEEIILAGRVSVNGHVITELGTRADLLRDRVVLDGRPLTLPSAPPVVVLLHKPKGYVTTTHDPEGRATVMDLVERDVKRKHPRLHPIGRLDFDTSGILLLTDDGDLTQFLAHPSHGVAKVYQARVANTVKLETVRALESGIQLEDGVTSPCRVRVRAQTENNALVEITLKEGRNRQVRRMLQAVGHPVSSLRRIKFGGLDVKGMATGESRVLLPGEVSALRKHAEETDKPRFKPRSSPPTKKPSTGKPRTKTAGTRAPENTPPSYRAPTPPHAKPYPSRSELGTRPTVEGRASTSLTPNRFVKGERDNTTPQRRAVAKANATQSSPRGTRANPQGGKEDIAKNAARSPRSAAASTRGTGSAKGASSGKQGQQDKTHRLAQRVERLWDKS